MVRTSAGADSVSGPNSTSLPSMPGSRTRVRITAMLAPGGADRAGVVGLHQPAAGGLLVRRLVLGRAVLDHVGGLVREADASVGVVEVGEVQAVDLGVGADLDLDDR